MLTFVLDIIIRNIIKTIIKEMHLRMHPIDMSSVNGALTTFLEIP
jgi:hypothetical protein